MEAEFTLSNRFQIIISFYWIMEKESIQSPNSISVFAGHGSAGGYLCISIMYVTTPFASSTTNVIEFAHT
jgi:hypothetical protein